VKTQFIGTWFISEMESWDADYINLVGPGHLAIGPKSFLKLRKTPGVHEAAWRFGSKRLAVES